MKKTTAPAPALRNFDAVARLLDPAARAELTAIRPGAPVKIGGTVHTMIRTTVRMFAGEAIQVLAVFTKRKPTLAGGGDGVVAGACSCCGRRTRHFVAARGFLQGGLVAEGAYLCDRCASGEPDEDWTTFTIV